MTTVPEPVSVNVPNMKVMVPLDALALIPTGVPMSAATLDCVTEPESVTMLPDMEPVSGNRHAAGLLGGLGPGGGESVPVPDSDAAQSDTDTQPGVEASAWTVTVTPSTLTTPRIVTVVVDVA